MPEKSNPLVNAAVLGLVAGMRSQLPLALLSVAARKRGPDHQNLPNLLASPKVAALLLVNAAGEIVVDKMPFTPSRLIPGSLIVRAGIGGLAGSLVARDAGLEPASGAAIGALGALVGSYVGYHTRASLVAATGIPDPLIAILEDVTAVAVGSHAAGLTGIPWQDDATRWQPRPSRT